MVQRITSRLTYANVVASLALFVALGGAGFAATQLPRNSVGRAQLKNNAVTGAKVARGSLSASDLSASARRSLRGSAGPAGPAGPQGVPGAPGAAGPPGSPGGFDPNRVTYRSGPVTTILASSVDTDLRADCGPGEIAISGGFVVADADPGAAFAYYNAPPGPDDKSGWVVTVDNTGGGDGSGFAVAVCAQS